MSFKDETGYITTKKTIQVTIKCKEQKKDWTTDIDIIIRGGDKLTLTIKANIIIPDVSILQPDFNFGKITSNEKSVRVLTFRNKSTLNARIIVDLNSNPQMKDFHVSLVFLLILASNRRKL